MDIRRAGTEPKVDPTVDEKPTAGVAPAPGRNTAAAARDGFVREAAANPPEIAALAPPTPPSVSLTETEARGAASFAAQLDQLGNVGLNEEDQLAKFLKLQLKDDKNEIDNTNNLVQAQHVFADLGIRIAKSLQERARKATTYAQKQYLQTVIAQVDRDISHVFENLKMVQERSLKATADKKNEKEDRSVGDPKKKRPPGKSGATGMAVPVAGVTSSDATIGETTVDPRFRLDTLRGEVSHAITGLLSRRDTLVGRQRSG